MMFKQLWRLLGNGQSWTKIIKHSPTDYVAVVLVSTLNYIWWDALNYLTNSIDIHHLTFRICSFLRTTLSISTRTEGSCGGNIWCGNQENALKFQKELLEGSLLTNKISSVSFIVYLLFLDLLSKVYFIILGCIIL